MKHSLRFKITAAFMVVTLSLFVLISLFANFFLANQFKEYIINKQEQSINDVVNSVSQEYNKMTNAWDTLGIETVGMNALESGLIIRVKDRNNIVIWDAQKHNGGMCSSILEHMATNMQSYNSNFQGGYVEKTYPIQSGGVNTGSVDVGYYGPYFYNDIDLQFLGSLNNLLFWGAFISLAACLLIGAYMARRMARPIARVVQTAGSIADGDLSERVRESSGTKEIVELTDSINSLAETLQKQETLRKRLTADVAHELRTPLATLQSHVEAMIDGVWEPDNERLQSFHEEIIRLSRMVGDLEKLSLYEGENLMLHYERFDISGLAGRLLLHFESDFKNKNIDFRFDGQELFVEADKDKISQVLINLLSNALKYTPEGGNVTVDVSDKGDEASIAVRDTGIGIPGEDLPFIFERFYRTDKSRTRLTGGSGIGLTIAKSIALAHHGNITVRSKPNEGSLFVFTLPKYSGR
jgi:two-component system sensor histidine kinase BaeS